VSHIDLGGPALALVLLAGLLSGLAGMWLFRRMSNGAQVRAAANLVIAHLLEFRLFSDEPALILKAQWDLLVANGRLLRSLMVPMLALVLPMAVLVSALDGLVGRAPLGVGEATVVTVQLPLGSDVMTGPIRLEAPVGFAVETIAVRVPAERQASWRVRAVSSAVGLLRFHFDGAVVTKGISSLRGWPPRSEVRAGTLGTFLLHPLEWLAWGSPVSWVRVDYPGAAIWDWPWWVWFGLGNLVGGVIGILWKV
jgi:hypothetical protein